MSEKVWFDALAIVAGAVCVVGSLLTLSAWLDARKYGVGHGRPRFVATGVAMGATGLLLAVALTAWTPQVQKALERDQESDLEQALDGATPTLQALHRYFPAEYRKAVAVAKANDASAARIHDGVAVIVQDLVQARLANLDDVSARSLFQMMLADAVAAQVHDPVACVEILNNEIASPATLLDPQLVGLDPVATAAMLRQLAVRPAVPAKPIEWAEVHRIFAAVRPSLSPGARTGLDTFVRTGAPPKQTPAACDLLIALDRFTMAHSPGDLRPLLAEDLPPPAPSQRRARGTSWRI